MRILYLDIDSLRPDHLGCYGYHRSTSPNIDAVARQGVRFNNCYASDAPCLPSRTALYSGRAGIHTGVIDHGGIASQPFIEGPGRQFGDLFGHTGWMKLLRRAGLYTVTFSPFGERHSAWHWYAGFNEIHNSGKCGMEMAHEVSPATIDWIDRKGKNDNWFIHLNVWDPHTPYRTPREFEADFSKAPLPAWYTEEIRQKHWAGVGPHSAREVRGWSDDPCPQWPDQPVSIDSMEQARRMFDGYDRGVRYADHHVGLIFDALKRQGIFDDTVIIISADHGENLGELNIYGDHQTADQITSRIPMIIRWPGVTDRQAGRVDEGLIHHYDMAASVIELAGGEVMSNWDGRSFAGALRAGSDAAVRDSLVVSQGAWSCQRGLRFNHDGKAYICIRSYHDGYHGFPDVMLFNLTDDPHEQHDLAATKPALVDKALRMLDDWMCEMMRTASHGIDPMRTVVSAGGAYHTRGKLAEYVKRLRSTDRSTWADRLENQHARDLSLPDLD